MRRMGSAIAGLTLLAAVSLGAEELDVTMEVIGPDATEERVVRQLSLPDAARDPGEARGRDRAAEPGARGREQAESARERGREARERAQQRRQDAAPRGPADRPGGGRPDNRPGPPGN